jgi:hypothetical protein
MKLVCRLTILLLLLLCPIFTLTIIRLDAERFRDRVLQAEFEKYQAQQRRFSVQCLKFDPIVIMIHS